MKEKNWKKNIILKPDDVISSLEIDFNKWDICLWLDKDSWEPEIWNIHKLTHTSISWSTNSWKTVTLKWLLYQLSHYKNSEFIILWKHDLLPLWQSKKVKYINNIVDTDSKDIQMLLDYIWLNVSYRNNIFNKEKVSHYNAYQELVKNSKKWDKEELPHLFIAIDEFDALRRKIWNENEFDSLLKEIANYVRSYWILFIFWSSSLLKNEIWIMRDYTFNNQLVWHSRIIQPWLFNIDLDTLNSNTKETYSFYSARRDKFLRIPYEKDNTFNKKFIEVWNKNAFSDNKYETISEMIDELKEKVGSDVLNSYKEYSKIINEKLS